MSARLFALVGLLTSAPAMAQTQILHEPIGCMVAGQFPLVEAMLQPAASVTRARVYFKSKSRSARYFVEMQQQDGRLVGKLPKPKLEDAALRYSVRASTSLGESQTREIEARIASDESECPAGSLVATIGPPGAVTVFDAVTGAVAKWPTFKAR